MRVPQTSTAVGRTPDDTSIPLLTERLPVSGPPTVTTPSRLPPLEFDVTLPSSVKAVAMELPAEKLVAQASATLVASQPSTSTSSAMLRAPTAQDWDQIETRVRDAVMSALPQQLQKDIENIVRQQVSTLITKTLRERVEEPLVARLTAEARTAVSNSLRDVVNKSVQAELARLKSSFS